MHRKNILRKRGLAFLLTVSFIFGSTSPAAAGDFTSGMIPGESVSPAETDVGEILSGTDENLSDTAGSPDITADSVSSDQELLSDQETFSDQELFSDQPESGTFSSGDTDNNQAADYILGRPMTAAEWEEQLAPMENLTAYAPLEDAESELGISLYSTQAPYYDSRDAGLVTSVKNQNPFGICWAFGLASNYETSLLSQGLGTWDLSEEHLAYFWSHRVNDPLGNTPDDRIVHLGNTYHDRGNGMVASFFLSTWSGMVTEDKAPLPTDSSHTADLSAPLEESLAYDTDVYLTDAVFSAYSVDRMKQLLQEYGSVTAMIYLDSSGTYYRADTAAACYPSSGGVNHAVTIVGWNDNYAKENFPAKSDVQNDGAWIVKNSYGNFWGDNGYFYLSYEDASITNLVSNTVTTQPAYPNNYFYDGAACGISSVTLKKGYSIANVFTATAGNGNAEELGEIVTASKKDNTSYQIQIYTDLKDPSDPLSGTPAFDTPMEYFQSLAGIDTITLETPVTLTQGSSYSVVLTLMDESTPYYVENTTTVTSSSWFQAIAGLEAGQSFYTSNGKNWVDCALQKSPFCFSIKAHTKTLDAPVATPTPTPATYKVTYHKNSSLAIGDVPSDQTAYTSGSTVTVKNAAYCNTHFFTGWNTEYDGSGTSYAPGDKFTITGNITLYAQWKSAYISSDNLIFRVKGKNEVTCSGTTDRYIKSLVVPTTIRYAGITYKVTSVWTKAFYGHTMLKKVAIGNNVTAIGSHAFRDCKNLDRVAIGTGLTRIGAYAFRNVKKGCIIQIKSMKLNNVGSKIDSYSPQMTIRVHPQKLSYYRRLFSRRSRTISVIAYKIS